MQELNQQLQEARSQPAADIFGRANLRQVRKPDDIDLQQKDRVESEVVKRLEEELSKRDELIEVPSQFNSLGMEHFGAKNFVSCGSLTWFVLLASACMKKMKSCLKGSLIEVPLQTHKRYDPK